MALGQLENHQLRSCFFHRTWSGVVSKLAMLRWKKNKLWIWTKTPAFWENRFLSRANTNKNRRKVEAAVLLWSKNDSIVVFWVQFFWRRNNCLCCACCQFSHACFFIFCVQKEHIGRKYKDKPSNLINAPLRSGCFCYSQCNCTDWREVMLKTQKSFSVTKKDLPYFNYFRQEKKQKWKHSLSSVRFSKSGLLWKVYSTIDSAGKTGFLLLISARFSPFSSIVSKFTK